MDQPARARRRPPASVAGLLGQAVSLSTPSPAATLVQPRRHPRPARPSTSRDWSDSDANSHRGTGGDSRARPQRLGSAGAVRRGKDACRVGREDSRSRTPPRPPRLGRRPDHRRARRGRPAAMVSPGLDGPGRRPVSLAPSESAALAITFTSSSACRLQGRAGRSPLRRSAAPPLCRTAAAPPKLAGGFEAVTPGALSRGPARHPPPDPLHRSRLGPRICSNRRLPQCDHLVH